MFLTFGLYYHFPSPISHLPSLISYLPHALQCPQDALPALEGELKDWEKGKLTDNVMMLDIEKVCVFRDL
jgi:hypothetical protein